MKALILAAGFGTRLLPHTRHTPKPLFPIGGTPLLDLLIHRLIAAGCEAVAVNTHYLHREIDTHLASQSYPVPVFSRYEPEILGTGGAIKNLADFWDDRPFLVVNSDIVTDMDFGEIYEFHLSHESPATLVLTDYPTFNSVETNASGSITRFLTPKETPEPGRPVLTFTGIQVVAPKILSLIPAAGEYSSIDLYRSLITRLDPPKAFFAPEGRWIDVGTPERYRDATMEASALETFRHLSGEADAPIETIPLAGDGSERGWYRLQRGKDTLICADHGIAPGITPGEAEAFTAIGRHLHSKGLPVPNIYRADTFSGQVFLEDLGNTHLETFVQGTGGLADIRSIYERVIDSLIRFSREGIAGFNPAWAYQTEAYDRKMILERECAYFRDAFLKGYLNLPVDDALLQKDFEHLATMALEGAVQGLMHRDFQSRNIMVQDGGPFFIDFQGARKGPLQYDLASLLIDPYVNLPEELRETLLSHTLARLSGLEQVNPVSFLRCYRYCAITRNLQMLGAFAFLSKVRGKKKFEACIPVALPTLQKNLARLDDPGVSHLLNLIQTLSPAADSPAGVIGGISPGK